MSVVCMHLFVCVCFFVILRPVFHLWCWLSNSNSAPVTQRGRKHTLAKNEWGKRDVVKRYNKYRNVRKKRDAGKTVTEVVGDSRTIFAYIFYKFLHIVIIGTVQVYILMNVSRQSVIKPFCPNIQTPMSQLHNIMLLCKIFICHH